ncbi:MAG TPA: FixH family protein [Moraxellaceae bacterium]
MTTDTLPWYRQFWPWFIMALPAAAVVAGISTVVIAVKNQDSVVRDDWYKDGKAINLDMAREQKAQALQLSADLTVDALTGEIILQLRTGKDTALPTQLQLSFSHATLPERDQHLLLRQQAGSRYSGLLQRPLDGHFSVELDGGGWRLLDDTRFPREKLHLGAPDRP